MEKQKTITITLNEHQYEDLLLLAAEREYHLNENGQLRTRGNQGHISEQAVVNEYAEEIIEGHIADIRKSVALELHNAEHRVKTLRQLRSLWQTTKRLTRRYGN